MFIRLGSIVTRHQLARERDMLDRGVSVQQPQIQADANFVHAATATRVAVDCGAEAGIV